MQGQFGVAIRLRRVLLPKKLGMANPSAMARTATKTLPAPVGQVVEAMPGHVAVKVTSFLDLAPRLANTPANLAKIQKKCRTAVQAATAPHAEGLL